MTEIEEHTPAPLSLIRVVAAIFFVGISLMFNFFLLPKYREIFDSLRVDLPAPTRLTFFAGPSFAIGLLIALGALVYLRSRKWLTIFILIVAAMLAVEVLSIWLPIQKIQEALRKK